MAIYTTQVRSICESFAGFNENGTYNTNEIISIARPKIFDFEYPYFTDAQKENLEKNILKHYYFEEIGLETYAQWKMRLDIKLNEIMPKYVNMYKLVSRDFDPLHDVDYTRTRSIDGQSTEDSTNKSTNQSDSTSTKTSAEKTTTENNDESTTNTTSQTDYTTDNVHWDKFLDTPQGGVTGIETDTYLTNVRKTTDHTVHSEEQESNTSSSGSSEGETNVSLNESGSVDSVEKITGEGHKNEHNNENLIEHIVGKYSGKSYAELMLEYYANDFYNIDLMIINDLSDLFMGLWR